MKKQIKEKELLLERIENYIANAPDGGLKFQRKNGRIYYYRQRKNPKTEQWKKTYIKKNQMNLARSLAQK